VNPILILVVALINLIDAQQSAVAHAVEHHDSAHPPAAPEGARFRGFLAAKLDASATAPLIA